MLKKFLMTIAISAGDFFINALAYNVIYGLFGVEELVFFLIAVIVCPLAFLDGAVGSTVFAIKKYRS